MGVEIQNYISRRPTHENGLMSKNKGCLFFLLPKLEIKSTLLRRIEIPLPTALSGESLCKKTSNQIAGWVLSSFNQGR